MTDRPAEITAEVAHAANAWAQQRGWCDLADCKAHPLEAFAAGVAAERERTLRELTSGDPSPLEAALRQFVDDEEAADCGLAVVELIRSAAPAGTRQEPGQ